MSQISIRSTGGIDRRIPLGARTIIGRAENSHVRLPDRSLSRHHAEIHLRDGGHYLCDLGSTNGTFLNGVRLERERPLRDGDVIMLGEITLVFHDRAVQPRPSPQYLDDFSVDQHEPTRVATLDPVRAPPSARAFPLNELVRRATGRRDNPSRELPGARVLAILSQASGALLSHHPLPELFEQILDLVLSAIPAERVAIMLLEGEPPAPVIRAQRSRDGAGQLDHVSDGIAREVIDNHVGLLLPDVLADDRLRTRASILSGSIRGAMCVPLWVASTGEPTRVLGLVYLDSRSRDPGFSETDLEILTMLANVAAAKLETARLLEENLEKRRLEEDLRLAADIQTRVLPRVAPAVPGFDIAASTRPCRTVGGDYYDLLVAGDILHLALGDVSGKGLGAAMLMIALRAAVRAHWATGALGEATTRINATFHQNVPDDKYATFFIGRLDVQSGRLVYVNAGHNRPLLVRASGGCESLGQGGTALGMFESAAYEEGQATLEPGDTLLVFSDGVSDTWPDADAADTALVELVRGPSPDAASLQRELFGAVDRLGPPRALDDCTLLLLKRLAHAATAG